MRTRRPRCDVQGLAGREGVLICFVSHVCVRLTILHIKSFFDMTIFRLPKLAPVQRLRALRPQRHRREPPATKGARQQHHQNPMPIPCKIPTHHRQTRARSKVLRTQITVIPVQAMLRIRPRQIMMPLRNLMPLKVVKPSNIRVSSYAW